MIEPPAGEYVPNVPPTPPVQLIVIVGVAKFMVLVPFVKDIVLPVFVKLIAIVPDTEHVPETESVMLSVPFVTERAPLELQ